MVLNLKCDLDGGLIIADLEVLRNLDESMLYAMDIALDPAGKTDLKCDYPGEDWAEVWERETNLLAEACGSGQLVFIGLHAGQFYIDLNLNELPVADANQLAAYACLLRVTSGRIWVIEASHFVESSGMGTLSPCADFHLAPGEYAVEISRHAVNEMEVGVFGSPCSPCMRIRVRSNRPGARDFRRLIQISYRCPGPASDYDRTEG
jgi:hypothetical protein